MPLDENDHIKSQFDDHNVLFFISHQNRKKREGNIINGIITFKRIRTIVRKYATEEEKTQ